LHEEIFEELSRAIVAGDENGAKNAAELALKSDVDAYEAIVKGCNEGMKIVGDKFEKKEYFVPEVLASADAMYAAVNILKPHIKVKKVTAPTKIVIGTVEGDTHDIGKNIVKLLLETAGHEVHDLGNNVPKRDFIKKANEVKADIIAMSALLTTTIPVMKSVVSGLEDLGMRDTITIVIGGAPTSTGYAREIGANGWAPDATKAVEEVERLLKELRKE